MSDRTSIEWTDASWNPLRARRIELQADGSGKERIGWHCEHVSPGCVNCYAERMNLRLGTGHEFKPVHLVHRTAAGDTRGDVTVFLDDRLLLVPLRWTRPRKVFPCSMTDLFADFVTDEQLDKVFAVMMLSPWHTYQVLTKRARRMREYFSTPMRYEMIVTAAGKLTGEASKRGDEASVKRLLDLWNDLGVPKWPLPNVWLGVSAEDQLRADERIPELLATLAAVRWVSAEPLLGPMDLRNVAVPADQDQLRRPWDLEGFKFNALQLHDDDHFHQPPAKLDWVVTGGESGPKARPMHPDLARSLRDQCAAVGVAFHFKQWGGWLPAMQDGNPDCSEQVINASDDPMRIGKKAAGRLLDGRTHDEYPA